MVVKERRPKADEFGHEGVKMKSVRMLSGAPPDSELQVRLTYRRTYKPKGGEAYAGDDCPSGHRTMLGFLLYDKDCVDNRYYGLDEAIDMENEGLEITFELIDGEGRVWTEEFEVDESDGVSLPEEIKGDLEHIFK